MGTDLHPLNEFHLTINKVYTNYLSFIDKNNGQQYWPVLITRQSSEHWSAVIPLAEHIIPLYEFDEATLQFFFAKYEEDAVQLCKLNVIAMTKKEF